MSNSASQSSAPTPNFSNLPLIPDGAQSLSDWPISLTQAAHSHYATTNALRMFFEQVRIVCIDTSRTEVMDYAVAVLAAMAPVFQHHRVSHARLEALHEFLKLASNTPVEDGDVPSKATRDAAISFKLARRCAYLRSEGYTVATYEGLAFATAVSRHLAKQEIKS